MYIIILIVLFPLIRRKDDTPNSTTVKFPSRGLILERVPFWRDLCTPEHSVQTNTPNVVEAHLGSNLSYVQL